MGAQWTADKALPGGNFANIALLTEGLKVDYPWLPSSLRTRFIRSYGTRTFNLLENIKSIEAMGTCFGTDLYQVEIDFLIEQEWAVNIEDIIWRRTKRGLYLSTEQIANLQKYLDEHPVLTARRSLHSTKVA